MSEPQARMNVRVRYVECDPMGVAHHSTYPVWFEMGRTELLRATGVEYVALEAAGIFLAVVTLDVRYRKPARYDDLLQLETQLVECGRVKIEHRYVLRRGEEVLATARTVLACLGRDGRPVEVPAMVRHAAGA